MTAEALAWWLVIEAIGLVALPIALVVFRRLPGAGYAFSKPLGILLGAYLFWLALSLHVLPNRPGSIVWIFLLLAAIDVWLVKRWLAELRNLLEERIGLMVAVEAVFTLSFAAAVYLRSFIPEISGTEKPMDFMLLNVASRARYYPPDDAWLAGFNVSYYYFGYAIQAMLAKLAAVPTAVAFNLGLASTAALTATAAFGIGYEVVRLGRTGLRAGLAAGVAATILVTVIGNLESVGEFALANGFAGEGLADRLDIANLDQARPSDACVISLGDGCLKYPDEQSSFWWWWRATRISPDGNSITEFPFFSFLLGDLHPHVMAIPFVLTAMALGLTFWRSDAGLGLGYWRRSPGLLLVGAVLVGGLGFLNTWDLPTFGFLIVLLVFAYCLCESTLERPIDRLARAVESTLGFVLPLAALSLLLYLPFYLGFSSQANGLEAVRDAATRPLHSALFWTPILAVSLPLPVSLLARQGAGRQLARVAVASAVPLLLLALWAATILVKDGPDALSDAVSARGANWLTALFFAVALVACLLSLWRLLDRDTDEDEAQLVPPLAAMATAFLLILGAELFFVRDVFASRLNTVFKLYYQAWLLLAVSGAFSLWWFLKGSLKASPTGPSRFLPRVDLLRGVWTAATMLVLAGAFLYPIGATLSRTNGLKSESRTLDGLAFARRTQPDDFAALTWLRDRAGAGAALVEAIGGQYSSFARVSAWSGVPAVIGWSGHEVQWGRDGRELGERLSDVDAAYSTASLAEALAILRKYDVTYVFVGSLEIGKYPPAGLQKFEAGLPLAFRSGQSAVYRVPVESKLAGEAK